MFFGDKGAASGAPTNSIAPSFGFIQKFEIAKRSDSIFDGIVQQLLKTFISRENYVGKIAG
ncbi:MAG TPA: hypothetical protein DIW64_04365 [Cellvibrio sp.]|nr:hypothetical protein [Cellvibrio sp.]